jgi:hypothetical protein
MRKKEPLLEPLLVKEIRKLAKKNPDFVYTNPDPESTTCLYVHDAGTRHASPGCIVGAGLANLGFSLSKLAENERRGAAIVTIGLGIDLDESTQNWLNNVQAKQDEGESWGVAVAFADNPEV